MKLIIYLLTLIPLSYGAKYQYWSECRTISKSECSSECKDDSSGSRDCYYINDYRSCWYDFNGGIKGPGNQCECECHSDCKYEEITKPISSCDIGKLETVDSEISEQIEFNALQAAAGAIPGIGELVDVAWAIWDPVSHITSPFALANAIRDEINVVIENLKDCMDENIDMSQISDALALEDGLLNLYELAHGASGDVGIEKISSVFDAFLLQTSVLFSREATYGYLQYEALLPVYKSLYPLWATIATERLTYLAGQSDRANYQNELNHVKNNFDTFIFWIIDARKAIGDHIDPLITDAECRNQDDMQTRLMNELIAFDHLYIDSIEDLTATLNKNFTHGAFGQYMQIGYINSIEYLIHNYYPHSYEYAIQYNSEWGSLQPVTLTSWGDAITISTINEYPFGDDINELEFGKTVLSKGLDNSPTSRDWYHNYILSEGDEYYDTDGERNYVAVFVKKLSNPWIRVGDIEHFQSLTTEYPFLEYEYGISFDAVYGTVRPIVVNSNFGTGIRIFTVNNYPMGDDINTLKFGKTAFVGAQNWNQYYIFTNDDELYQSNGIRNDVSIFVKKLSNPWMEIGQMTEIETLVNKYPFTHYEYGLAVQWDPDLYTGIYVDPAIINGWGDAIMVSQTTGYCVGASSQPRFAIIVLSMGLDGSQTDYDWYYDEYYIQDNKETFPGGGNTYLLYAKRLSNPWTHVGELDEMDSIVKNYSFTEYEYGIQIPTLESELGSFIYKINVNSWDTGISVETVNTFPIGTDRFRLKFARVVFTFGKDNAPSNDAWYQQYIIPEGNEYYSSPTKAEPSDVYVRLL